MTPGILRCPFCGTSLDVQECSVTTWIGPNLQWGVLGCECCAYPVIDGIPVILATNEAREAMRAMEAGHFDEALRTCLGLDAERWHAFERLRQAGSATYRDMLDVLSPDAEGTYFLYRFSDPTFVVSETLLGAIAQAPGIFEGPVIDVCGGSGHLARVLVGLARGPVHLADVYFWKLWLARTFTALKVEPVCCDANQPLPFARGTFAAAILSDAFPYIWQRRMLASELMRTVRQDGVVIMPHLHSALGNNHSQGMALSPAAYADLFAPMTPRLFSDAALLTQALAGDTLDLTATRTPEQLGTECSFSLIASCRSDIFKTWPVRQSASVTSTLQLNPLYRVERRDGMSVCTLRFPSEEYEEEFGDDGYLPQRWTTPVDVTGPIDAAAFGSDLAGLRRRRILIDAPARYC